MCKKLILGSFLVGLVVLLSIPSEVVRSQETVTVKTVIDNSSVFPDAIGELFLAFGDVTNDGYPDLVITKGQPARASVFQRISGVWDNGTLLSGPSITSASVPVVGPIRNDGNNWLIYSEHRTGNTGQWLRSHRYNGTTMVENVTITSRYGWPGYFTPILADLDGNGDLELWFITQYGSFPYPYQHLRRHVWDPATNSYPGVEVAQGGYEVRIIRSGRRIKAGDFLGNGSQTLVWETHFDELQLVEYTPGSGVYDHTSRPIVTGPKDIVSFDVGEFDGAPGTDIALATWDGTSASVYLVSGKTFNVRQIASGVGAVVRAVRMGDLDGDGLKEIYASDVNGKIYGYDNNNGWRLIASEPGDYWTVVDSITAHWPGDPKEEVLFAVPMGGRTVRVVSLTIPNVPPVVTADKDTITVDEGQTASNGGTVTDVDSANVTLSASIGSIVDNEDGTWSWSYYATDGPADSQMVTVTADDGQETDQVSFSLVVNNVAPTVDAGADLTVSEGGMISLSPASFNDPGTLDTHTATVNWSDGTPMEPGTVTESDGSGTVDGSHVYADNGNYTVEVCVTDDDTGETCDTLTVTVNNLDPYDLSVDVSSQAVQYSDSIADITLAAKDVAADTMSAAPTYDVDGGGFTAGLPAGMVIADNGCSDSSGIRTCTWTLSGVANVPEGTYTVHLTVTDDDGGSNYAETTIIVSAEDASVSFYSDNPVAVKVSAPGGDSDLFSLTVYVAETQPDVAPYGAHPGDISQAHVSMSLVPVGPGGSETGFCTPVGVTGVGYDAILEVRCEFANVPVNTYAAEVTVDGGYYAGSGEDVLTVYDPSLGFTTGGGWFYWPDTTDKTNFGYTMKYNQKGERVQGSLLLIRHMADGTIYRVKSNALSGLALGEDPAIPVGWASFSGKCTYLEPGWDDPIGNHEFLVYVEDRNEPGNGYDQFWIDVRDGDGYLVSLSLPSPAMDNSVTLDGGNLVVPHASAN